MPTYSQRRAKTILSWLGSYWSQYFNDQETLNAYIEGQLTAYDQLLINIADTVASVSRFKIPVFRTQLWQPIVIYEDKLTKDSRDTYKFDEDDLKFDGSITFDEFKSGQMYRYGVPKHIKQITAITDRIVNPHVVLTENLDFRTENGYLYFKDNPFQQFPNKDEYSDNETKKSIVVWCYNAKHDLKDVYRQFGHQIGIYLDSDQNNYKKLVNAVWDGILRGPNVKSLRTAVSAMFGVTSIENPTETVEFTLKTYDSTQVVTDKNVYTYHKDAVVNVSEGDVLYAGDIPVNSLKFFEGQDKDENLNDLYAVTINPDLCAFKINSSLVFENKSLPTSYEKDSDGHVTVKFPVGGKKEDVAAFWAYVKEKEKATGFSIANALRTDNGRGQPLQNQVKATVNPMLFLVNHLFRNNVVFVTINIDEVASPSSITSLEALSYVLDAHVAVIYAVNATADIDEITSDSISEVGVPLELPASSVDDTIDNTNVSEIVKPFYV